MPVMAITMWMGQKGPFSGLSEVSMSPTDHSLGPDTPTSRTFLRRARREMGLEWQTPLALLFLPHTLQSLAAYSEGRVLGRQPVSPGVGSGA